MRTSNLKTVAVGTTAGLVLPAAPDRVVLQFHASPGAQVFSIGALPSTTLGTGMTLSQATGPIVLRREELGDALTWPWYAVADVPGGQLTMLEVLETAARRP